MGGRERLWRWNENRITDKFLIKFLLFGIVSLEGIVSYGIIPSQRKGYYTPSLEILDQV